MTKSKQNKVRTRTRGMEFVGLVDLVYWPGGQQLIKIFLALQQAHAIDGIAQNPSIFYQLAIFVEVLYRSYCIAVFKL